MNLSFGFSQPPLGPPGPPGPPGPLRTPGPFPFGCLCKDRLKIAPQFHYGGTACFSCRAFFRRAHQKKEVPDFKCLKVGMKPETVLTDGQNDTSKRSINFIMSL